MKPEDILARRQKKRRLSASCRYWVGVTDVLAILIAFICAYYVRFSLLGTLIPPAFADPSHAVIPSVFNYLVRLPFATVLEFILLFYFGAYDTRTLLRHRRSISPIIKASLAWVIIYPGISLLLSVDEFLSRGFVLIGWVLLIVVLVCSRLIVQRILLRTGRTASLRQRLLFIDWTSRAQEICDAVDNDQWHPYEVVGCAPPPGNRFTLPPPGNLSIMGSYQEADLLLEQGVIDIAVLASARSDREIFQIADTCERHIVDFMIIPSGFQILMSGLELSSISGVPLLGITRLPLDSPVNALIKRCVDVVGALIGLLLSAPFIVIVGLLIFCESPGSIFFGQQRVGRKGELFKMYKLRSMKLGSEKADHLNVSTLRDDPRLLRIGKLIRRLNIDELPQFWNVLRGDMSLVGPRPERLSHATRLRWDIAHYNARWNSYPGMTGWSQVNGLRGDSDMGRRVEYDLFYIENWSLLLDFQIMFMTFYSWKGAY